MSGGTTIPAVNKPADTLNVMPAENMSDEELKTRLFAAQVKEAVDLQERIKRLQERLDIIKQQILDTHPDTGKYETQYGTATVRKGATRLDAKAFTQAYPPAEHPGAYDYKPIATSKLIKLYGTQALEGMLTQSAPTLTIN